MTEAAILKKLRAICLALPDSRETRTFGHPTFQVRGKTFCVLETYKGALSICVKVEKTTQSLFLEDRRFYRTPYIGQHGWVSLKTDERLDWDEIAELAAGSHALINRASPRRAAPPGSRPRRRQSASRAG